MDSLNDDKINRQSSDLEVESEEKQSVAVFHLPRPGHSPKK